MILRGENDSYRHGMWSEYKAGQRLKGMAPGEEMEKPRQGARERKGSASTEKWFFLFSNLKEMC